MSIKTSNKTILELWILIDKILFHDKHPRDALKEDYQKYLEEKSAFIINLTEIRQLLGINENDTTYQTIEEMYDYIQDKIEIAKELATKFLQESENIKNIKKEITKVLSESTTSDSKEEIASRVVNKYYKGNMLDYALLKEAFRDHIDKSIMGNWKFKLLFNTHKVMRENLLKYAEIS